MPMKPYSGQRRNYEGERNSFMFSLLVLSSYIINADGKIMHSEMELVRNFLRQNFGEAAKQQGEEILLKLFEQQKRIGMQQYRSVIQDSCHQIRSNMMYEQAPSVAQLPGYDSPSRWCCNPGRDTGTQGSSPSTWDYQQKTLIRCSILRAASSSEQSC